MNKDFKTNKSINNKKNLFIFNLNKKKYNKRKLENQVNILKMHKK